MHIQQIRNATLVLTYAGKKIIIDPWLRGRTSVDENDDGTDRLIPTVDLPMSAEDIIKDIEAIVITHTGDGHFDHETADILDKYVPIFTGDEEAQKELTSLGFHNVEVLSNDGTKFDDITLYRTEGQRGELKKNNARPVCGVMMRAPEEETLYIAGDTIFYDNIAQELYNHCPGVVVLNACGAVNLDIGRMIMDATDVVLVAQQAPTAKIVVSHMEALEDATVSREKMREYVAAYGVDKQVTIPDDGEVLTF